MWQLEQIGRRLCYMKKNPSPIVCCGCQERVMQGWYDSFLMMEHLVTAAQISSCD